MSLHTHTHMVLLEHGYGAKIVEVGRAKNANRVCYLENATGQSLALRIYTSALKRPASSSYMDGDVAKKSKDPFMLMNATVPGSKLTEVFSLETYLATQCDFDQNNKSHYRYVYGSPASYAPYMPLQILFESEGGGYWTRVTNGGVSAS